MAKYKDELLKRMQTSKKKNLAAFLAVKDDVAEAMELKIPVKFIHADLVKLGRINIKYVQFLTYVKKHIKGDIKPEKNKPVVIETAKTRKQTRDEFAEQFSQTNPFLKKLGIYKDENSNN